LKQRLVLSCNRLKTAFVQEEILQTLPSDTLPMARRTRRRLRLAKRGDYVHDFEIAAFGLKEGELSPLFKTPFGFHSFSDKQTRRIDSCPAYFDAHCQRSSQRFLQQKIPYAVLKKRVLAENCLPTCKNPFGRSVYPRQWAGSLEH